MTRFGVAGYPLAFTNTHRAKDRSKIFAWLRSLGLDALELQMTYGPRTKLETCRELRSLASDFDIKLSVHASYFIVFTSEDSEKVERSSDTLKRTYELASELAADVIVLHPGPLYGGSADAALDRFRENASRCLNQLGKTDAGLFVETAGKTGQLGSCDEIFAIARAVEGTYPCIDFGHVHARTRGTLDNPAAIQKVVAQVEQYVRQHPGARIHFHYTPIHYGPKGEIQHRAIDDVQPAPAQQGLFDVAHTRPFHPRPESVATALRLLDADFTVISETHNSQEVGGKTLKAHYLAQ